MFHYQFFWRVYIEHNLEMHWGRFASSSVGWKMKEKPELLSLSSSVRTREQKASTSKTSSSRVHMRARRAKYDAALLLLQCFCQFFANNIKCYEVRQEILAVWRKNDVSEGPFASFCFFHLELWPPVQQKPRTCCTVAVCPRVAVAFHGSFYHSFYTYCTLKIGQEARR